MTSVMASHVGLLRAIAVLAVFFAIACTTEFSAT
jgi:hypothetical protein